MNGGAAGGADHARGQGGGGAQPRCQGADRHRRPDAQGGSGRLWLFAQDPDAERDRSRSSAYAARRRKRWPTPTCSMRVPAKSTAIWCRGRASEGRQDQLHRASDEEPPHGPQRRRRVPGSDHASEEAIVIGAHYDQWARRALVGGPERVGQIHNGADDNASGTPAMIEMARAAGATVAGFHGHSCSSHSPARNAGS